MSTVTVTVPPSATRSGDTDRVTERPVALVSLPNRTVGKFWPSWVAPAMPLVPVKYSGIGAVPEFVSELALAVAVRVTERAASAPLKVIVQLLVLSVTPAGDPSRASV